MDIILNTIQATLDSFDFAFCISVNVLTYLIIKAISDKKGNKELSTWHKRIVLLVVIFSTGVLYICTGYNCKTLINSAILAPVFWSWVMKPICKYFKVDYKDINLFD